MKIRSLITAGIAAAAGLTGVGLSATAAQAAPSCPSSALCVWSGAYGGGSRGTFYETNSNWSYFGWNDRAVSARNNGTSGQGVVLYEHSGFHGKALCLPRTAYVSNLGSYRLSRQVSSNLWTWSCHY